MDIKKILKNILVKLFLIFVWVYPAFLEEINNKHLILAVAFLVAVEVLNWVKNKTVSFVIIFLIFLGATIYHYEFIFFALPPMLLLIAESLNAAKKIKMNKSSVVFIYLSYVVSLVFFVYTIIKYLNNPYRNFISFFREIIAVPLIFFVFVFAFYFVSKKAEFKRAGISKDELVFYRRFYLYALIGVSAMHFFIYFSSEHFKTSTNILLFYWFIFAMEMFFSKDVFVGFIFYKYMANE